ncbi:MAG: CHC2 zinc finger domain-containing protein [Eubacteriales bacterium]|nr:CHC2 zinc finger domain-containing protein [Eubacteriales bacterium]
MGPDLTRLKTEIPVSAVLARYGVAPDRNGRCACPIHHGHDRNMRVKEHSYKCFVCGSSGTVLDLVMAMEDCTLDEAARRLAERFDVMGGTISVREKRALQRRKRDEMSIIQSLRQAEQDALNALSDYLSACRKVEAERPKSPTEEWTDAFADALRRKEAAQESGEDAQCRMNLALHPSFPNGQGRTIPA